MLLCTKQKTLIFWLHLMACAAAAATCLVVQICGVMYCAALLLIDYGTFNPAAAVCVSAQICGVMYCLTNLGPWCAAAAAYLDLLAPPTTSKEEAAAAQQVAVESGNVWQGGEEEDGECGALD
jgi:hypothetical protein